MSIDKSSFDLFSKKTVELKAPEATPNRTSEAPIHRASETPVTKNVFEDRAPTAKIKVKTLPKKIEAKSNKYESFLPVTLRLKEENFMDLKHIENSIMRSRPKIGSEDRERITSNSILRCLVTSFIDRIDLLDFEDIDNEEILNQRIQKLFKAIPQNINQ